MRIIFIPIDIVRWGGIFAKPHPRKFSSAHTHPYAHILTFYIDKYAAILLNQEQINERKEWTNELIIERKTPKMNVISFERVIKKIKTIIEDILVSESSNARLL